MSNMICKKVIFDSSRKIRNKEGPISDLISGDTFSVNTLKSYALNNDYLFHICKQNFFINWFPFF